MVTAVVKVTTVEVKAGTWSKYRDVQWIRGEDRVSGREKKWYRIREREREREREKKREREREREKKRERERESVCV